MAHDMSITERAVIAALEQLADENARSAVACMATDDAAGARLFQRAVTAYTHASAHYQAGARALIRTDGRYAIRRPGGGLHLVGRDGRCSCKAGAAMHWPIALMIALEVAGDYIDQGMVAA